MRLASGEVPIRLEFLTPTLLATSAGSPGFAEECIDQSIKNLGSAPDIWLLHRIDANTPVEESVRAMEEARKAGKCRFIGLSAVSSVSHFCTGWVTS